MWVELEVGYPLLGWREPQGPRGGGGYSSSAKCETTTSPVVKEVLRLQSSAQPNLWWKMKRRVEWDQSLHLGDW